MTNEQQPEALRLADTLENDLEGYDGMSIPRTCQDIADKAAAELRRLHAENEDYGATIDYLTCENAEQIGEIVALKEQRDELLESLATCRANFRRHEEETLKMAQAEDEERASLRAQRDELLEALQYLMVASGEQLTTAFEQAQEAITKATGETK